MIKHEPTCAIFLLQSPLDCNCEALSPIKCNHEEPLKRLVGYYHDIPHPDAQIVAGRLEAVLEGRDPFGKQD